MGSVRDEVCPLHSSILADAFDINNWVQHACVDKLMSIMQIVLHHAESSSGRFAATC